MNTNTRMAYATAIMEALILHFAKQLNTDNETARQLILANWNSPAVKSMCNLGYAAVLENIAQVQ